MASYVERIVIGTHARRGRSDLTAHVRKAREAAWGLTVVAMERFAGYRRGLGNMDFHIAAEVKDLVARKGREARTDVENLVHAVMRAGSYTIDEAGRAVHAVVSGLGDKVPVDLLLRVADHLPPEEGATLRAALERRAAHRQADSPS
ncbi:MAG: hypothetical protein BWY79_00163 [Actinobacteria bacterium ADurb.Bin444]|nr:MAG: hypothetical protein BWY79_00163 [Actinobacteria bacterium ADurb.Bin444]